MVNDPERWSAREAESRVAFELADALERPVPPTPAEEHALAAGLRATGLGSLPGVSDSAGIGVKGGALLGAGVVSVVALWFALGSGSSVVPPASPPRAVPPPAPALPSSPLRSASPPVEVENPSASPPIASTPKSGPIQKPHSELDLLREEERLLEGARRSASATTALALLREHQARFPRGQLVLERMYLLVVTQERLGNVVEAREEAERLKNRYPDSVYARRLQEKK